MVQFTVVIPTFGRKEVLLKTLNTLETVDFPRTEWELIVVDDGSKDGTEESLRDWIATHDLSVSFHRQENRGPGAARNRGAFAGRGERLVFIDNDITVPARFLQLHAEALDAHPGCWILGRVMNPPSLRSTPFGRYKDDWWETFHRSHACDRPIDTEGITTQNLSMPRADFLALCGFDERWPTASAEDWDLAHRARQSGIRVMYDPRIVVIHNDWASDLEHHCQRQAMYSTCDVLLWQKYGAASPRTTLVVSNLPLAWRDPMPLKIKKAAKAALATRPGNAALRLLIRLLERWLPDRRTTHATYRLAEAVAIFVGVRTGIRRYGAHPRA
jgi:glycosyltransferase involved in cell wall biosynthesis